MSSFLPKSLFVGPSILLMEGGDLTIIKHIPKNGSTYKLMIIDIIDLGLLLRRLHLLNFIQFTNEIREFLFTTHFFFYTSINIKTFTFPFNLKLFFFLNCAIKKQQIVILEPDMPDFIKCVYFASS